jgi:hypothetical protein
MRATSQSGACCTTSVRIKHDEHINTHRSDILQEGVKGILRIRNVKNISEMKNTQHYFDIRRGG